MNATTASRVTSSCASTPSQERCLPDTLWMPVITSCPALAEVREKAPASGTYWNLSVLAELVDLICSPPILTLYANILGVSSPIIRKQGKTIFLLTLAIYLFISRTYSNPNLPPSLPGHGRPRNATNSTHPMHSRCNPDPGLTALMSDHRGATYAFSGERLPQIPHLQPPGSFSCTSSLT